MSPPLRVALIDHMTALGGGELAILRLAKALRGAVKLTFVIPEPGPFTALLEREGEDVRLLPIGPVRGTPREEISPLGAALRHGPELVRSAAAIARLVRKEGADLVYTNSLKAHVYGSLAARMAHLPAVVHVRDILAPPYLSTRLRQGMRAYLHVLRPAAVISNSAATAAAAPVPREPHVIPSGISIEPGIRPVPEGPPVLGLLGRLTPWKGQDVAIRALPELLAHHPRLRLRIGGDTTIGSETYASALRHLAESLGVAEHVEWVGFVEDPYAFLNETHVALHTSINPEPFGQVIVEALALGRPVVATSGGGPSEILGDGKGGGVLTPPGDHRALASAVRRFLEDPRLRKRAAEEGVRRAGDFTLARGADLTHHLLTSVAARR